MISAINRHRWSRVGERLQFETRYECLNGCGLVKAIRAIPPSERRRRRATASTQFWRGGKRHLSPPSCI